MINLDFISLFVLSSRNMSHSPLGCNNANISIETIRKFKEAQGKNHIWYAGDFLRASCMDMAVYTGKKAAKNIIEKYCK